MTSVIPASPRRPAAAPSVARYVGISRAPATVRAYQADLEDFGEWCQANGVRRFPATADVVARYLAWLADCGAKPSTIERRAVAISAAHKAGDAPNPTTNEIVRKTLGGIRRAHGRRPAKKRAISLAELRAMCLALPDTVTAVRDRAVLTLAYAGAFRRSEVAQLERADVVVLPDELVVTLRKSKTDQEGRGIAKHIPIAQDPAICPVRAMRAWLAYANVATGPVFRPIDRWGVLRGRSLTGHAVAIIVKRAAAAAGLDPDVVSGHSMRSGFITAAYVAGQTEADIMELSGHRSLNVMRGYRQDSGAAQRKVVRAVFSQQ